MCPGEGGDAIADADWHYRHCPSSHVARVTAAALQPADFTATSFSAASITAVVVAVAANADASFTPPPPAPPAERRRRLEDRRLLRRQRRQRSAAAATTTTPPHTPTAHAAAAITPVVHTLSHTPPSTRSTTAIPSSHPHPAA